MINDYDNYKSILTAKHISDIEVFWMSISRANHLDIGNANYSNQTLLTSNSGSCWNQIEVKS